MPTLTDLKKPLDNYYIDIHSNVLIFLQMAHLMDALNRQTSEALVWGVSSLEGHNNPWRCEQNFLIHNLP